MLLQDKSAVYVMLPPFTPVSLQKHGKRKLEDQSESSGMETIEPFQPLTLKLRSSHQLQVSKGTQVILDSVPLEMLLDNKVAEEELAASCGSHNVVPLDVSGNVTGWWIERVLTLPAEKCTGWVLAQILDAYAKEDAYAKLMDRRTFSERMAEAGRLMLTEDQATSMARSKAVHVCVFVPLMMLMVTWRAVPAGHTLMGVLGGSIPFIVGGCFEGCQRATPTSALRNAAKTFAAGLIGFVVWFGVALRMLRAS